MTRLRHIAVHIAIASILALLVAVGYEDRQHAALAIVCASNAAAALVAGVVFAVIALRQRAKGRRWSALDWLATASFALGVLGVAALSLAGLIAASRPGEGRPALGTTIIALAFAALGLAVTGISITARRLATSDDGALSKS